MSVKEKTKAQWTGLGVAFGLAPNGPRILKAALDSIYSHSMFSGRDINERFFYAGEIAPKSYAGMVEAMGRKIREIASKGARPAIFGGDHSISYAAAKAIRPRVLLDFDAHLDMLEEGDIRGHEYENKSFTHATWLRRTIEERLVEKVVCIGVRDCTAEELAFAKNSGVKIFTAKDVNGRFKAVLRAISALREPAYVSIDSDVLDPSSAPETTSPAGLGICGPGLLELLQAIKNPLGCDVVEIQGPKPQKGRTKNVAAHTMAMILREWWTA